MIITRESDLRHACLGLVLFGHPSNKVVVENDYHKRKCSKTFLLRFGTRTIVG